MSKILTEEAAANLTGEHIIIPDGYTEIEGGAFANRDIVSITIPEGITQIGNGTFRNCEKLKNVKLPESLTSLGNWTFNGCESLEYISIPQGVDLIGAGVFRECRKLHKIDLPESVLIIYGAFEHCSSLKEIRIPPGVKEIIPEAFIGCSALERITVDKDNAKYSDIDGVLFNKDGTVLVRYPDGKMPECLEREAFYSVPESVVEIGNYAFSECRFVNSINIPRGLTRISRFAFRENSFLPCTVEDTSYRQKAARVLHINVDSANESYADIDGVLFNKDKTTLIKCPKLQAHQTYYVPHGVLEIADYAFEDCTEMRGVVPPDTLNRIGDLAFIGCANLERIVIPQSVTYIGWGCFVNCVSLMDIDINVDESMQNITFTSCGIEFTAWYAKQPDGVVYLGKTAVTYKGDMPPNSVIAIKDGTKRIAQCAFDNSFNQLEDNLIGVIIPESVIQIGEYAFQECSSLTDVVIKGKDTVIAEGAFKNTAYGLTYYRDIECVKLGAIKLGDIAQQAHDRMIEYCADVR